jgi:hypothetical protein
LESQRDSRGTRDAGERARPDDAQRALDAASGEPRTLGDREDDRAERGWEGSEEQRAANEQVDQDR